MSSTTMNASTANIMLLTQGVTDKKSWYAWMKRNHPDKGGVDSTFSLMKAAWDLVGASLEQSKDNPDPWKAASGAYTPSAPTYTPYSPPRTPASASTAQEGRRNPMPKCYSQFQTGPSGAAHAAASASPDKKPMKPRKRDFKREKAKVMWTTQCKYHILRKTTYGPKKVRCQLATVRGKELCATHFYAVHATR